MKLSYIIQKTAFIVGQLAYEMMETAPDWSPSLYLGQTDIIRSTKGSEWEQQRRDQRGCHVGESEQFYAEEGTHEAKENEKSEYVFRCYLKTPQCVAVCKLRCRAYNLLT